MLNFLVGEDIMLREFISICPFRHLEFDTNESHLPYIQ